MIISNAGDVTVTVLINLTSYDIEDASSKGRRRERERQKCHFWLRHYCLVYFFYLIHVMCILIKHMQFVYMYVCMSVYVCVCVTYCLSFLASQFSGQELNPSLCLSSLMALRQTNWFQVNSLSLS